VCEHIPNQAISQNTYLAALGDGVGLFVLVRSHSEVLVSLPRVPLSPQQNGVGAGRCPERELVESDDLAAGLQDAVLGRLGEAEGCNRELGDLGQTHIVRDGADLHDDLRITVRHAGGLGDDFREGNGGLVDLGKEEAVEDVLYF
jgi:hypothetical protein